MSGEYEYVDEDGNPIDPSTLGDDVEIIEEVVEYDDNIAPVSVEPVERAALDKQKGPEPVPAAIAVPEEAPGPVTATPVLSGRGKFALAGAGVAVVAVLGVVVFGLSALGNQHTVDDVKAGASSKVAAASASVEEKKAETVGTIDTCKVGMSAATTAGGTLSDAMADGGEKPKLQLDVLSTSPLPGAFTSARTNADGAAGEISMLQLTKNAWGVYVAIPLTKAEKKAGSDRPGYHKADVTVTDDSIRVTGDRPWPGGDVAGAGSCEPGKAGAYAATGSVPADAVGLVDGTASVGAIQGVAGANDLAVAVMGNSVVLVKLVEAPESRGGDAAPSSSAVPSK